MEKTEKKYRTYDLIRYEDGIAGSHKQDFVREEPLLIRVEDIPYSVVMRTPGDEIAHAAGLCLSEGLVESCEDIASIDFCNDSEEKCVTVKLSDKKRDSVSENLKIGGFHSRRLSCIDMIDDLIDNMNMIAGEFEIRYEQVYGCVEKFFKRQKYYARTRGTHAVMIFDSSLNIISEGEDVGRHNAMDKSVGSLLINNRMSDIYLAVLSSRISFEMIQKAVRSKIPILISLSNPTSIAVEIGMKLNMTLISLDKKSGFIVSCGKERVIA